MASIMYGEARPFGVHEIVAGALGEHGGSERHPEVAVLDHPVDEPDHARITRIGEDRAVAEGPRAELHAARASRHHPVRDQQLGDALLDAVVERDLVAGVQIALADHRLRLRVGDRGSEIGRAERGGDGGKLPAPALREIAQVGRAHRVRLVPARREGEEVLHPVLVGEEHVGLHVHEHAAAQRQAAAAVARVHEPRPVQQEALEQPLGARGHPVEPQPEGRAHEQPVALAGLPPVKARGAAGLQPEYLA
jgi:hypothetical protein